MEKKELTFTPWEIDFFEKLDAFASKFKTAAEAAEALGVPVPTFNSYRYRFRHPKHTTVEKILDIIGEKGETMQPVIKRVNVYSQGDIISGEDLPEIPVIMAAGAGEPIEEDFWQAEPKRSIQILPQYYRDKLVMVEVMGDSMEPTIKKGAFVGVVPMDGSLHEGAIYLVRRPPFGLLIKRIRSNKDGEIVLISDNPNYEPQPIPYEGYDNIIVGQVVWSLQMV